MNKKYSFKDFTHQSFKDVTDLVPGTVIVGTCFYQENHPDSHIFPETMTGVTFLRCNLDNVFIPPGNIVGAIQGVESTQKRIKVQNDNDDWILDNKLSPVEPMNKKQRIVEGRSIDPKDIPAKHFKKEEMTKAEFEDYFITKSKKHQWFKGAPAIIESVTSETTAELQEQNLPDVRLFDAAPEIVGRKTKPWKSLKRVEQAVDGKFIPIWQEQLTTIFISVKGMVTCYKVRGEAWLYAGQEAEEVR